MPNSRIGSLERLVIEAKYFPASRFCKANGNRALGFRSGPGYSWDMSAIESNLLQALVELDQAVKRMPTAAAKPELRALFSRIEELRGQLPNETDPTLLHYLDRKSYEKARLWLQGHDAENQAGNCRPGS